jgi:hypothetical protein
MHFIYDFCILSMFFLVDRVLKYSFEMLNKAKIRLPFKFWVGERLAKSILNGLKSAPIAAGNVK